MENPHVYRRLASDFARLVEQGRALPLGGLTPIKTPEIPADAPKALFFAPHPDDETIMGGLALRLLRESRWKVIDVAVTQGSRASRKVERFEELRGACNFLGFGLRQTGPEGLEGVTVKTRTNEPAKWAENVKTISSILAEYKPRAVFLPHEHDWNATHIGTHFVVMDALKETAGLDCYLVEFEFWGQMASPNLVVEYAPAEVGDLVAATSFHLGEVKRNPYHVNIPAWMLDNVRRGAELVGGQGGAAPSFLYGQLFRLRSWRDGKAESCQEGGRFLGAGEDPASLFQ